MKTQLYTYYGIPLFEVAVDESSSQDWSLMSDNKLSISFELEECVVLTAGCYIDFDSTRFYLLNEYKPTMICSSVWKYDLTLGDAASWLSITLALKTIDDENTPLFKYTAPAAEHAAIIVANLNRRMDTDQWKVGSVISTENIAIDYSGKYCSDVLQEIVDAKNTEWWIEGMTLNIGRAEFGESVTLGYMNGVLGDIVCDTAGDMRSYAYLFPIGSTRNIDPTKYGHDRLQLPSGLKSVPINPEQGVAELVEEAAFAHIYPRYEGTVSAVRYTTAKNEDGTSFLIYYIKDTAIPFNPNEFEIPGLVKHITFQSGELMGQEFEVNYSADSNEFELITRWTGDIQLPGGVLVPAVGDKYVVWNISMPDVYYTIASHELLDAARAYAADAIKDVSVYKVKLDYIDVQERGLKLRPGQRVRLLSNEYFASGHYDSRITRITRNIAYPDELSVDISAVRVVGTLSRLQASIQKTENVVAQFSGQLPAIIKSNDDTSANDSSVYTSAKSEKEFLNKRKGGRVAAPVTFDEVAEFLEGLVAHKYIKVGNGYLKYDDELGVWEMVGDLFVTGNFAWGSSIDGFKPSTVMDAVRVDDSTIIKKKDSNGDWYLYAPGGGSGGSGGGLTLGDVVSYLSDNDYTTKSNVNSLIASSLAGYATQSWVGDNYLATSGGAIEGVLELNSTNVARSIRFNTSVGSSWLFVNSGEWYVTNIGWGAEYKLIHSGNIGQQSVSRAASAGEADSVSVTPVTESGNYSLALLPSSSTRTQAVCVGNNHKALFNPSTGALTATSFVGNLTGNADSADVLKKSFANKDINYGKSDGLKLIYCHSNPGNFASAWQSGISVITDYTGWQLTSYGGDVENPYFRSLQDNGVWKPWRRLAFLDDNVASANRLRAIVADEGRGNLNNILEGGGIVYNYYNPMYWENAPTGASYGSCAQFTSDRDNYSYLAGQLFWDINHASTADTTRNLWWRAADINGWTNSKWHQIAFTDSDVLSPSSGLLTVNGNAAISGILTMSDNTNPAICFGSYWYLQRLNNTIALGLGYTNSLKVNDIGDVEVAGNIEGGIFGLRNSSPDNPLLRLTVGNQNYYVQATSDGIYLGSTSTLSLKVDANGNTTINGNLLVNGNVSWYSHSQRSLKNIISEKGLSLAQLERIKPIKFYWKDGRDMALHVGGVADVFAEVLPEVVALNLQDILCLNYVDAAFYVGASLIAPVLDHERRITKGEAEQEALKKENAKLKRELEEVKSKLNHLAA